MNRHARLFDLTNSFIARQLLGEVCFNLLCKAVKEAAEEASEEGLGESWQTYIAEPWKTLVKNKHFIRAYYLALLAYYDMSGDSFSMLTADGRVTHKRPLQEGGKENVFLKEAQYIAIQSSYQLNLAITKTRTWILSPLYRVGKLNCYNNCFNANLLGCSDKSGKFWHE